MENKKNITLKSGWWGVILSAIIIISRTFQPSSEPMSDWSVMSWLFMLTPVLFPFYLFIIAKILQIFCDIAIWCLSPRKPK